MKVKGEGGGKEGPLDGKSLTLQSSSKNVLAKQMGVSKSVLPMREIPLPVGMGLN